MRRTAGEKGYAVLLVVLLAALIMVSLSIAVPRLLTQGQREKEAELIFRGQQYQRAIGLYYKKFGRYPNKVDELLETNDRAFLRRAWADPMNPDGEWHFIRVGPGGAFLGSVRGGLPGQAAGGTTASSAGEEGAGTADAADLGEDSPYPLAGVASRSTRTGIRVYEGFTQYNEWEFIYDPTQEALQNRPGGQPATQPGNQQGSPQGGTQGSTPSSTNPGGSRPPPRR